MHVRGVLLFQPSKISKRIVTLAAFFLVVSCLTLAQVPGPNVNMVSGTTWPAGDPWLQRQNEPSMAVSTRNPEHLMAGSNDYRSVDVANPNAPDETGDAWLGVYTSLDGGDTWRSTLLPGYPQDTSPAGIGSPLHNNYLVATDPTVRAGTHGLFYYAGLAFNRGNNAPSAVFVSTFQDQNNKGNGDSAFLRTDNNVTHGNPFQYLNTNIIDSGTSGQFIDKPWVFADIPRQGQGATCTINNQTFTSGYVYIAYTVFNGSQTNPSTKILTSVSKNCGATWSKSSLISQGAGLSQGAEVVVDPGTGYVYVVWRVLGSNSQILFAYSTNGGASWTQGVVYRFPATSPNVGGPFDQPSGSSNTFRTDDIPTIAVDGNGRVWVAFSQRVTAGGLPGSRIYLTTFPRGGGSKGWTTPYVADSTAPIAPKGIPGHQFMPSLTFAYGKLMLAWYDTRYDDQESILECDRGTTCTNLGDLTATRKPIPGSGLAANGPSAVYGTSISDPAAGIRHTIDVFGGMLTPPTNFSNTTVQGFEISEYAYWVNPNDTDTNGHSPVIEQGFFNPPNLPMFVQGKIPFIGDYIDAAALTMVSGPNGTWTFNSQANDPNSGAPLAPIFHVTWTDNRDVVPPPCLPLSSSSCTMDWTKYVPPNGGHSLSSSFNQFCPTCQATQDACSLSTAGYSGDRNQNIYTSRITPGLLVRFVENSKPLAPNTPRAFSLKVRNTVSPLSTTPLGAPSYYRIMLGVTSPSQTPSCSVVVSNTSVGSATLGNDPNSCVPFQDLTVYPKSTATRSITVKSSIPNAPVNVLVAQIQSIPTGNVAPTFLSLRGSVVLNGDPSNPGVATPDFLAADNTAPDSASPYGTIPITSGEVYDPTVSGVASYDLNSPGINAPGINAPSINAPGINAPGINAPGIVTTSNNAPSINSPNIVTVATNAPGITSVQVVNPTVTVAANSPGINAPGINAPGINAPGINAPSIVNAEIFSPNITSLGDGQVTDYTHNVNDKGNTSASYNAAEFAKTSGVTCCPAGCSTSNSPGSTGANGVSCPASCSKCQLIVHKAYATPTSNWASSGPGQTYQTCDLTVQEQTVTLANIPDPAFTAATSTTTSDPSIATLALGPGEGHRVTLRVVAPPVTTTTGVFPVKANAAALTNDLGTTLAGSLLVTYGTTELPVAVVGQTYRGATLTSTGGISPISWVLGNPTTPAPVSPVPTSTSVSNGLALSSAGQISGTVSGPTGPFPFTAQVQDSKSTLDQQPLVLDVNQLTISNVTFTIDNQVSGTSYMKAGDTANVTVIMSNQGRALATGVLPTLAVNAVAVPPSGPAPTLSCPAVTPGTVSHTQDFIFTCTVVSGNGYVSFTANATGHYVNSVADVLATAPSAFSSPSVTPPGATPPNVVVDVVPPTLTFGTRTAPNVYGWNNSAVTFLYTTNDNLSGVKSHTATAPGADGGTPSNGTVTFAFEGANQYSDVTVTDNALNGATFRTPVNSSVNIDFTPPVIATPTATAGGNPYSVSTWTNKDVNVTFACSDNLSGPLVLPGTNAINNPVISGLPPSGATVAYSQSDALHSSAVVTLTAETSGTTLTANCQDFAGNNSSPATFGPIMIDKTPPVLVATGQQFDPNNPSTATGAYTSGTWTNQNVTVTYTCTDNTANHPNSGVPTAKGSVTEGAAALALTSANSGLSWSASAPVNAPTSGTAFSGSCTDAAGNVAVTAPLAFTVMIDRVAPSVSASSPANTMYVFNTPITATYNCTETNGDPVVSCVGSYGASSATPPGYTAVVSGSQYAAAPVGPDTFVVTSTDAANNQTSTSVQYLVVYSFTGFQAPLQNAVMMNPLNPPTPPQPSVSGSFTIGTTIPVAWQLQDAANNYISDLATLTSIVAYPNAACSGPASGSGTTLYNAMNGPTTGFSYDNPNNRFVFNWNTSGMTAPGCYNLVVTTNDTAQWSTIVLGLAPDVNGNLPAYSCSLEGQIRSLTGSPATATNLSFTNNDGASRQIFWLNYNGSRVFYNTLQAGQSYVQGTYLTHPWVIADTAGVCQEIFVPDAVPTSAPAVF